jgi:two-component system, OmpR family, phosphate regulon response regulator OmpR
MTRVPHFAVVSNRAAARSAIAEYLGMHGFRVTVADGGAALRRLVARGEAFDLVILDGRMSGEEDGALLARWVRESPKTRVIVLTAPGDRIDAGTGVEAAGDGGRRRPFDFDAMLAEIRGVLAGGMGAPSRQTGSEKIRFGRLVLDLAGKALATETGAPVPLTSMEFDLLRAFATHPDQVLSRDRLLHLAHGKDAEPFDRSIDIRIARLRRKIERVPEHPELIKTVRGVGYVFVPGRPVKDI